MHLLAHVCKQNLGEAAAVGRAATPFCGLLHSLEPACAPPLPWVYIPTQWVQHFNYQELGDSSGVKGYSHDLLSVI